MGGHKALACSRHSGFRCFPESGHTPRLVCSFTLRSLHNRGDEICSKTQAAEAAEAAASERAAAAEEKRDSSCARAEALEASLAAAEAAAAAAERATREREAELEEVRREAARTVEREQVRARVVSETACLNHSVLAVGRRRRAGQKPCFLFFFLFFFESGLSSLRYRS